MNSQISFQEMLNNKTLKGIILILLCAILIGCSGVPNPIDKFRADLLRYPEYSVTLADMKEDEGFAQSYFHKYTIITGRKERGKDDLVFETTNTDWMRVPQKVYKDYENYLGMTILAKDAQGKISDTAQPPGYQYIGNEHYGQWKSDSSGHSFWEFYGKYMFMSSMFHMIGNHVSRNDYNNYRTYQSTQKPYFGTNNEYGTSGTKTKETHPNFFERRQQKIQMKKDTFNNKVGSRYGRSSSGRSGSSSFRSRGFRRR